MGPKSNGSATESGGGGGGGVGGKGNGGRGGGGAEKVATTTVRALEEKVTFVLCGRNIIGYKLSR